VLWGKCESWFSKADQAACSIAVQLGLVVLLPSGIITGRSLTRNIYSLTAYGSKFLSWFGSVEGFKKGLDCLSISVLELNKRSKV
jgi:hypothetical protein